MTEWVHRGDGKSIPTEQGLYRVMVTGDSESIDGYTIYSFPDYATWAVFIKDEDGGFFKCEHDEEDSFIFAYYGPIVIPPYSEPEPCQ